MRGARMPVTTAIESPCDSAPLGGRLAGLLDVEPEDLVVGLGAGAFGHCLAMLDHVSLRYQMILVDPSPRRLRRLADRSSVRASAMSALEFARHPIQWDKVVLDETLAADGEAADELVALLFQRLRPGGRISAVLSASGLPPTAVLRQTMEVAARLRDAGFEVAGALSLESECGLVVGVKRAST